MQYISPFNFLSSFFPEDKRFDDIELVLLKKQIMAEFELLGKTTITIDKKEYSKNEIIALLNQLTQEELSYHLLVQNIPGLLFFLENHKPNNEVDFSDVAFNDSDFIKFLAPYLSYSLGLFYVDCIKKPSYSTGSLNIDELKLPNTYDHLIKDKVYAEIELIIHEIESIQKNIGSTFVLPDPRIYFKGNLIETLNKLPSKYFSVALDLYLQSGINLLTTFLQKRGKGAAFYNRFKFVYHQLNSLNFSSYLRKDFNLLEEYFQDYPGQTSSTPASKAVLIALLSISIFVAIIRISVSDSSQPIPQYDFSNTPWYKQLNKDMHEMQTKKFDSIYKINLDSLLKKTSRINDSIKLKFEEIRQQSESAFNAMIKNIETIKLEEQLYIDSVPPLYKDSLLFNVEEASSLTDTFK